MNAQLPFTLVLAAALSLAAAPTASASEPSTATASESSLTITLELDAEETSESARAAIRTAAEAELGKLGLTRVGDSADLLVRVRIWQPEPNVLVIDSAVEFEGEVLTHQEGVVCMDCPPEEAASKSLAIVPDALEQARAARARSQPPPPVLESDPLEHDAAPPRRRARALGPVGYVGIGTSVIGLGSVVAGALFLHRGRVVVGDPGAATLEYLDHRPLGVGLLGAGLGVMVVGNVLLGVDLGLLRPRREQRESARAIQVTGVGMLARENPGLAISGRF